MQCGLMSGRGTTYAILLLASYKEGIVCFKISYSSWHSTEEVLHKPSFGAAVCRILVGQYRVRGATTV